MDDEKIVICLPDEGDRETELLIAQLGSKKGNCEDCGSAILLAPSSAASDFKKVCINCSREYLNRFAAATGEKPRLLVLEEAKRELRNYIGRLARRNFN